MRGMKPLSVKQKLTLYFIVFFCLPFLLIGFIWNFESARTIEQSAIYFNEQLVQRLNNQLDDYFREIKEDTQNLPGHPLIQQFIKLDPNNSYEMYQIKKRISDELYPDINYKRKDIVSFHMYSVKGGVFGESARYNLDKKIVDHLQESSFIINGIVSTNWSVVPAFVTVSRLIYDNVTYQPAGVIVFVLKMDPLLSIADVETFGKEGYITIVDAENRYMYHPDKAKWGETISEERLAKLTSPRGQFVEHSSNGKKNIVYNVSRFTKLTIISEVSLKHLIGNLADLRTITLLIAAVILVLAFINFNKMLLEVKRLVEVIHISRLKEKESELKHRDATLQALQSQINPHFLYNTLEVINSLAVIAKNRSISSMTVRLANLLRYRVGNPRQIIHLREEIDHVSNYIKIQQERYEKLEFSLEIDEEMLDRVALFRLTIQPIVENSFLHGYENHGLPSTGIYITGKAHEDYYSLIVADKGRGMSPEWMAKYNEAFESVSEQQMLDGRVKLFTNIGLWNVHSRLRLSFGAPFGLTIVRSDETGTEIEIKLPYYSHANLQQRGDNHA